MYPNRNWFTTYERVSKGTVIMENNAPCKIIGVGTVRTKCSMVLSEHRCQIAVELKWNLISLSTLNSTEYKYSGKGGVLKVSQRALVVMKG